MPVAARLARRFGPKPVVISVIIILGIASLPLANLDTDTSYSTILQLMVIRGVGLMLFLMTATTLGMNAPPLTKVGRVTSMKSVVRQVAGSFGITLFTTVIQYRQAYHQAHIAGYMNIASLSFKKTLDGFEGLFGKAGVAPEAVNHILTYKESLYGQAGFAPGAI